MDICKTDVPELLEAEGGHSSACHLTLEEKQQTFTELRAART
jgi:hypothetical protein